MMEEQDALPVRRSTRKRAKVSYHDEDLEFAFLEESESEDSSYEDNQKHDQETKEDDAEEVTLEKGLKNKKRKRKSTKSASSSKSSSSSQKKSSNIPPPPPPSLLHSPLPSRPQLESAEPEVESYPLVINLRKRIKNLEQEKFALTLENAALKRELKSQSASNSIKSPKSAKKLNPSKYFKKWGKAVSRKAKQVKFYRSSWTFSNYEKTEVVVEEAITKDIFDGLFKGRGILIQPTPQNKPTSVNTIINFGTFSEIDALFGAGNVSESGHVCNIWQKGGVPMRFGGGFAKSRKTGTSVAQLDSLSVHYNRTKMKLLLKFGMTLDDY